MPGHVFIVTLFLHNISDQTLVIVAVCQYIFHFRIHENQGISKPFAKIDSGILKALL